jgi:hypothetical protein
MAPSSALNNALLLTVLGFGGWLLVVSAAKGPANDYVQEIVRENGELRALNDYLVDFAQLEGQTHFYKYFSKLIIQALSSSIKNTNCKGTPRTRENPGKY